jgi:hypothetical protein
MEPTDRPALTDQHELTSVPDTKSKAITLRYRTKEKKPLPVASLAH